jgi:hypothetical protein
MIADLFYISNYYPCQNANVKPRLKGAIDPEKQHGYVLSPFKPSVSSEGNVSYQERKGKF